MRQYAVNIKCSHEHLIDLKFINFDVEKIVNATHIMTIKTLVFITARWLVP
jgi:hypothetical protein